MADFWGRPGQEFEIRPGPGGNAEIVPRPGTSRERIRQSEEALRKTQKIEAGVSGWLMDFVHDFIATYGQDAIVYGIAALLVVIGLVGMIVSSGAGEAAVGVAKKAVL